MAVDRCSQPGTDRRRTFWTTQLDACGTSDLCGFECGTPGLVYQTQTCITGCRCCPPAHVDPDCLAHQDGANPPRSFATNDWLRSLAINMLMTDGKRPDTACGYPAGSQGGHWSESYSQYGLPVGTLVRTIGSAGRVQELVAQVQAYASSTLQRMVAYGVAAEVNVTASYIGGNRVRIDIDIIGKSGDRARVGLQGGRLENGWVWR